jgi:hypothetical protein
LITITGSGFTPQSKLQFHDGMTTYYDRTPIYVDTNTLQYNIRVGNVSADWTVKVINTAVPSNPAPFTVTGSGDVAAPAAPLNPSAQFAWRFTHNVFYVDWTNPSDASGISKVWWKIGSPPTSNADGIAFDVPLFQPFPIVSDTQQTVYFWLQDGAGNMDYHNYASVVVQPPTIGSLVAIHHIEIAAA